MFLCKFGIISNWKKGVPFFLTNFSPLHPEILGAFRVMPAIPSTVCQGTIKSEDTLNGLLLQIAGNSRLLIIVPLVHHL